MSAASPSPRSSFAMTMDANNEVVLFGGDQYDQFGNVTFLNDTWTWDGTSWTERHPLSSPSPRCCFGMAYDAARGQVVLYGGCDPNYLGDTWTWDGENWTERYPAHSLPFGCGMRMAYDGARREVVMYGGEGNTDTWTWDGNDWTKESPKSTPPWRVVMGMAYDGTLRQTVIYGGESFCFEDTCFHDDTWAWNGRNWKRMHPIDVPPARSKLAMAYDRAHNDVVMFGGSSYCCFFGSTWTWDGVDWTLQSPATSPKAREAAAMVYDEADGVVMLFGGRHAGYVYYRDFDDTWIWDGSNWTCVAGCR